MKALHRGYRATGWTAARRVVVSIVAALGTVMLLPAEAQDTIRIAHIDPFSGSFASVGNTTSKTMQYAIELINARGGVLGKKLELVSIDNAGDANKSLTAFNSATDQDIRYIVQATNSGIAGATLDAVVKYNERNPAKPVLYLNYGSALPDLTEEKCSFWMFRFEPHQLMKMRALAEFVASDPTIRNIYLINQDYAFGQVTSASAKAMIKERRPDVNFVGDVLHPVGKVKDFAPYIAKIKESGADTVLTGNFGADLSLLVKSGKDFGLKVKYLTYYGGLGGAPTAVGEAGDGVVYQVGPWHPNVPVEQKTPAVEAINTLFKQKYKEDLYYSAIVVQMDLFAKAVEKAGGAEDPKKVALALEGIEANTPFGPVRVRRDDHQLIQPLLISVFSKGVKYDAENTGLGWRTVMTVPAKDTELPTVCKMKRPA
ncbi:MAG: branched-chain amino acid ABC transporter substrate-binding protein [Burkholderiaceae bacterium]